MKFRPNTTTSERQLCIALAATGRTVSLDELTAWRKDGLLPPMASTGLGAGKGKSYYWREEEIVARAQGHIRDWIGRFNRSFATPSSEDLRRAGDALEASGSALSSETAKLIRFHLKGW